MSYYNNKKEVKVTKPNSFESAVWKYATCTLSDPIPDPKTRIEQLAQAFVFSENIASDIRKLKEINRCITLYETYDDYQKNPDSYGTVRPVVIQVAYGRGDDDKDKKNNISQTQNPAEQSWLGQKAPSSQETTVPAVDSSPENSAGETPASAEVAPQAEPQLATEPELEIPDDLPELSDYASIQEVCDFFYKLTKDAAFLNPPKTRSGVLALQDKLREPAIDRICSSLKGDNRFKCNIASDRLFDLVKEMEEYEVEQEEKIALTKAGTFGR